MINRTTLAQLRPGVMVVNTSRGGVIDEQALVEALQRDHLFGVALDVLDPEPIRADHPLLAMDPRRVILTPHFGAWCRASTPDLQTEIANAVAALLSGRLPASTMNPLVKPRFSLIR
jgi:phosphoglycerate dehydrogenase-like enzyme